MRQLTFSIFVLAFLLKSAAAVAQSSLLFAPANNVFYIVQQSNFELLPVVGSSERSGINYCRIKIQPDFDPCGLINATAHDSLFEDEESSFFLRNVKLAKPDSTIVNFIAHISFYSRRGKLLDSLQVKIVRCSAIIAFSDSSAITDTLIIPRNNLTFVLHYSAPLQTCFPWAVEETLRISVAEKILFEKKVSLDRPMPLPLGYFKSGVYTISYGSRKKILMVK